MYVLGNPFPKPENDVHFHVNMPKQQAKVKQKEHGEEYSVKIGNNVMRSKFDTAPEHPVEVKGSVLNSNFHNYRGRSVDVVDDDEEETLLDNQDTAEEDSSSLISSEKMEKRVRNKNNRRGSKRGRRARNNGRKNNREPMGGLGVGGHVLNSDMWTARDHAAKIGGNIENSVIHNYGKQGIRHDVALGKDGHGKEIAM